MLGLGEHEDPAVLRSRAREKFIARRTVEEQKLEKWRNALMSAPSNKVADKVPFQLIDLTLQNLIPEWYVELPNPEIAKQQVIAANEKIALVNQVIIDLNKEGIALLEEYNAMN